jgi:alkyldihydroxyacetonephosphate synthase
MGSRARSHWGWGFEDKLPDDTARGVLGTHVASMLGLSHAPTPRPLPRLDDARVPTSRIAAPAALAAICDTGLDARVRHTFGKGFLDQRRGFDGDFAAAPDLVAGPRDERDIEAVLEWAARDRLWVVPFGGGTSVVRGVEAVGGAAAAGVISLDLGGLARVLEVDPVSRAARIQAGALGPELEAQLGAHGLSLRFYPQSFEHSTLGGWIATRAGGHFATGPTHIDDLVESVRMITPRGAWQSRRLPASGAGPAPDRLVLGSEGVLGVITEAWVRVRPRPRWRASASVRFTEFLPAVEAVRALAQSGLEPANCRLLDAREAQLNGVASGAEAVLVLAFESADHALEAWLARAVAIAAEHGGVITGARCKDDGAGARGEEAGRWRDAFLSGPYLQSALISLGMVADTFETACTWDRFPELHREVTGSVREALATHCGGGEITCRFTHVYPDGPAPYFTFFGPGGDGDVAEKWHAIKHAASEALLRSGGTITHHHAVGRLHRPWYEREVPTLHLAALAAVKRELDPAGILNPGVLLRVGA